MSVPHERPTRPSRSGEGSRFAVLLRAPLLVLIALAIAHNPLQAQYTLAAPSGFELELSSTEVRAMLDTTRALEKILQEDPRVLYFTIVGQDVPADSAMAAYPWNAIEVRDDSVATILTPGNLREADRAYYNYAVVKMSMVRTLDPDVSCDELMAREVEVVSRFADGWLVSRVLFGGLAFEPLDEIVFARHAQVVPGMLAALDDRQLGACADEWAREHPEEVAAYESWRATFLGTAAETPSDSLPVAGSAARR